MAVYRKVALDARNFLARVITLQGRRVGVLDALRGHNQERVAGVAPLFYTGRANLIFKACSSRLPPSRGSLQMLSCNRLFPAIRRAFSGILKCGNSSFPDLSK